MTRLAAATAMIALAGLWPPPGPAQSQTFRGTIEVIAVDVQVVDRRGVPVTGLGPDEFEVTIDGRPRRVFSADLIDSRVTTAATRDASRRAAAPPTAPAAARPGRVVILAVDCGSFDFASARGVVVAARTLIEGLPADDLVGLFAFPVGPKINPTADRPAVLRALNTIAGQRDTASEGEFHLRPSEILELSQWAETNVGEGADLALKICGTNLNDSDVQQCRGRLMFTVKSSTIAAEGEAHAGLGMMNTLLGGLAGLSGRKTIVLASAGRLASDVPGARPNLDELAVRLGKAAAEANTAIYTLFLDQGWLDQYKAEARRPNVTLTNLARDRAVLGRWLELFSGSAGGSFLQVLVGDGAPAFGRIVTEMSAYYLLGVEPADVDRDGRAHQLRVKVRQRDAVVRGRSWVVVPRRTVAPAAAPPVTSPAPVAATRASSGEAPTPRPLPEAVVPLAAAFERGEYAAMHAELARSVALANVIRDFRVSVSPWPAAPRRAAVFALELSLAGLASRNGFANDEALKLLVESNTTVRQSVEADAFECAWFRAAVAGLEGLWRPATAELLLTRAVQRCPADARLRLALAVVAEQQGKLTTRQATPGLRMTVIVRPPDGEILRLYDAAMKFPETEHEARARAAWFSFRTGGAERAFALIDGDTGSSSDPVVRYQADLIRGEILRARGRVDDAAAAFRTALTAWPGAQSARVALVTLLLSRGDHEEAARLADAVQRAPDEQFDPWWLFEQGDFRLYQSFISRLREAVR
jgi:VWFA-related protein